RTSILAGSGHLLVFLCPCTLALVLLFFSCSGPHRYRHSFPTRRSSDLHDQVEELRLGGIFGDPEETGLLPGRAPPRLDCLRIVGGDSGVGHMSGGMLWSRADSNR